MQRGGSRKTALSGTILPMNTHDLMTFLLTHFLPRWTLANMLGWSLGLYLGGALLGALNGVGGVLVGGAAAGAVVGAAQWLVLRFEPGRIHPRWALLSAAGGGLATLPAYAASATLVAGPQIGYFAVGAVYGGIFSSLQWLALRRKDPELGWMWIVANVLAGGLCGCMTMTMSLPGLPLVCSPGPAFFGLLTGWVMPYVRQPNYDS